VVTKWGLVVVAVYLVNHEEPGGGTRATPYAWRGGRLGDEAGPDSHTAGLQT